MSSTSTPVGGWFRSAATRACVELHDCRALFGKEEAEAGRFSKDMLYRVGVVGMTAPPLGERGPDAARLAEQCWKGVSAAAGSRATLARETVAALAAHPWLGNVRELSIAPQNRSSSAGHSRHYGRRNTGPRCCRCVRSAR